MVIDPYFTIWLIAFVILQAISAWGTTMGYIFFFGKADPELRSWIFFASLIVVGFLTTVALGGFYLLIFLLV